MNSPKLSRPGSWKEPHLLKLIPDRKKLRVKAADMEEKSCRREEEESVKKEGGEDHQTSQQITGGPGFDRIPLSPLSSLCSLHGPDAEEPSSCFGGNPSGVWASTYHLPGEGLVPEGGAFLQAEEGSTNRSSKGSSHPSSCTRRHKVPLISERRAKVKR